MESRAFWHLLGLSDLERDVYRHLVTDPVDSPEDRATHLRVGVGDIHAAADTLVELHLARRTPHGIEAIEPRTSVTALARGHQAVLDQAGLIADDLASTYAAVRMLTQTGQLTQVLRADEITGRLIDMLTSATTSVDATAAPPFVTGADPDVEAAELRLLARGVPFRAIYESSALESPAQLASIATTIERGEQARALPGLTTKMIIVDSSVALLPLTGTPLNGEVHAVVITRSSISDALSTLFQQLWDRATPLLLSDGATSPTTPAAGPDRQLLTLLNTGMSDLSIARHLGISERTFRRRVQHLQEQLSAGSRFQLGSIAAQRRLLPQPAPGTSTLSR